MKRESLGAAASQVSLLVFLHVTRVTEAFPAVAAAERLLPGVVAQVHRQVARLAEALAAHRAAVRLLPGVHPAVLLVVARVSEGATAERAAVVFSHVSRERVWAGGRAFFRVISAVRLFRSDAVCVVVVVVLLGQRLLGQPEDEAGLAVESRTSRGSCSVQCARGRGANVVIEVMSGARDRVVLRLRLCFHVVLVSRQWTRAEGADMVRYRQPRLSLYFKSC